MRYEQAKKFSGKVKRVFLASLDGENKVAAIVRNLDDVPLAYRKKDVVLNHSFISSNMAWWIGFSEQFFSSFAFFRSSTWTFGDFKIKVSMFDGSSFFYVCEVDDISKVPHKFDKFQVLRFDIETIENEKRIHIYLVDSYSIGTTEYIKD